ncbi:rrna-processing protein utp23 homolog [Nannochloropsis oceanica]
MRVNRAKQVRKWLRFYRIVYGVAPPYMILIDGNFIYMALKVKIDIKDRLKKMLLGESFVCCIPKAVLDELAALGPAFHPALEWARTCCEVLCNPPPVQNDDDVDHDNEKQRDTMSAGEAIRTLIGEENKDKYMVATQDQDLRSQLRHVPSVGLLFVSRAVLLMEAPSNASKAVSAKQEGEKFRLLSEEERLLLANIRMKDKDAASGERTVGSGEQQQQQQQEAGMGRKTRAKKKPKGPNPLSVKKSDKREMKKKTTSTTTPIKSGGAKKEMSGGCGNGGRGRGGGVGGGESGGGSGKKRKRKKRNGAPAIGGGGKV